MLLLFAPAPLIMIAALAVGMAASLLAAPFGLFLLVILLSWTVKYSIAVLDALLAGARALPVLSVEIVVGSLKQWRLLIALGLAVALFFALSATLQLYAYGLLVTLAAATPIVLPPVLATQAWTRSTEQALRPSLVTAVARLLGADYLRLVGICAVLVFIVAIAATRMPLLPVRVAVYLACWFAMIVLVGQTVQARRAMFEAVTFFQPPLDLSETAEKLAAARERAADEIYAHWRNGAQTEAWNSAQRYANAARHPAEEWLWLQRRVGTWDAKPLSERIALELGAVLQNRI